MSQTVERAEKKKKFFNFFSLYNDIFHKTAIVNGNEREREIPHTQFNSTLFFVLLTQKQCERLSISMGLEMSFAQKKRLETMGNTRVIRVKGNPLEERNPMSKE